MMQIFDVAPQQSRSGATTGAVDSSGIGQRFALATLVLLALTLSPHRRRVRMSFRLLDHNAKAEDFVWFLHDLRNDMGRKLHVVNLSAHRKTESFLQEIGLLADPGIFHSDSFAKYAVAFFNGYGLDVLNSVASSDPMTIPGSGRNEPYEPSDATGC